MDRKKQLKKLEPVINFPETNPNPLIETDLFGKITYLNPAAEKLFPDLKFLGRKHPCLTGFSLSLTKLKNSKGRMLTKEVKVGSCWYRQDFQYLPDIKRVRIYGFDISENIKLEEKLIKDEMELLEVVRVTGAGYYEHAVDYSTGGISKRFAEILGFKLKELPKYPKFAKWWASRIHKKDFEKFKKKIFDFYEGRTSRFEDEYRVLAKNNNWIWLHVVAATIKKNSQGLPSYVAGLIFDITERKNMEKSLQESEEKLKKTQEIAHIGTWELNYGATHPYWSDETFRIYGYKPQGFIPTNEDFDRIVYPDDRQIIESAYQDSIRLNKNSYEPTFRIINQSTGEIRILHEKCEHTRDAAGKIIRTIGMVQDITEQKKAEEALRKSEEKFRKFSHAVEQTPASIVITDLNGTIEYVNKGFVDGTGYTREEAIGGNPRILQSRLTPRETYRELWKTIKSGKEWIGELCNKKKNGELYWEQVSISPVKNADGQIINYLAVKNDITLRKNAEEALKESEEKFRAVAETAKDAIISANAKGEIIYFNKGAEQTFGYSASEVLNKSISIIMPQRFRQAHKDGFSRFIKGGQPNVIGKTVEMSGEKKDGSEFPLELSLASWQTNHKTFITAIIRDITERKNLDQRKDDFITIAGHELRTPVSAVRIMNQVLREMLADNPQALKYLDKIDLQTSIQANLINDLLDVSKIQTGKMDVRKEYVDLNNIVNETAEDMQQTTDTHKIVVNGKICGKILADKDRIRQVIVNFCTNAIKFSPEGKKIVIRLEDNKNEAIVGVTDYGIGIPNAHHHRIFERFYRVYGTGDKTYPGLGMGLYISYQIIKLLNGKMWFESKPGKGSTFYLSLPFQA